MHRPPLTSADLAVLRSAHENSKEQQPARPPSAKPQSSRPEAQRPFWGLLAQKLGALLSEKPSGAFGLTLAERNARREV
jgi:hypothetical protein